MNNLPFQALSAELRDADPLCRYVVIERTHLELLLLHSTERTSQLTVAVELLEKTRAELVRIWGDNELEAYQQTALRSIEDCLSCSRSPVRLYRHSVRREFASVLRNLLMRTQSALKEDAAREREQKRKQIAHTIEDMGEGLTIVLECLDSLLSQLLAREELSAAVKQEPESDSP